MADAPLTGNYPELPEPQGSKMLSFATAGDIPGWILYVKQYARAAIDADRAARSDPPSPPVAGPRPVTPYTCPECHALWLHWPAEQSGFGMDTLNCRSTTHCDYCEKGGVEQLRRLERVPATLSAPAAGAVAGPVLWVSPGQLEVFKDTDDAPFGNYIPARKTSAGKFTMPLFAAAPTPAAQAADSVLEDAARLDFLCSTGKVRMIECEQKGLWRVYQDEAPPEAAQHHWQAMASEWHGTPRAAIDAARKQGANHD